MIDENAPTSSERDVVSHGVGYALRCLTRPRQIADDDAPSGRRQPRSVGLLGDRITPFYALPVITPGRRGCRSSWMRRLRGAGEINQDAGVKNPRRIEGLFRGP